MTLDQKKEHSFRCIKLGMSMEDSLFIAECTDAEIEELLADEKYQHEVKLYQKLEEMELLKKHNVALDVGIQKGNTKPIEWRLAKMSPEKWGAKVDAPEQTNIPQNIHVTMKGVPPKKEDDTDSD